MLSVSTHTTTPSPSPHPPKKTPSPPPNKKQQKQTYKQNKLLALTQYVRKIESKHMYNLRFLNNW